MNKNTFESIDPQDMDNATGGVGTGAGAGASVGDILNPQGPLGPRNPLGPLNPLDPKRPRPQCTVCGMG